MNIVEVQDNLKNFSQDQLISEINQPSGMVPQFLVLTELGRRNRMKQDIEGRQAQNQPTVAQEVVSAAGVPQGGIMDMARSMAPKSSIEQNDGVQMMEEGGTPKNRMERLLAYLRSLGADEEEEVKEATGGKSIAEIINFGGDFRPVKKKADGGVVKMQTAGRATREVVYDGQRYLTDGSGRVFKAARRNSMRRGQEITDPDIVNAVLNTGPNVRTDVGGISNISANLDTFKPISSQIDQSPDISAGSSFMNFMGSEALNEGMPVTDTGSADMSSVLNMTRGVPAMRDPAVIDPTTGLPYDALSSLRQQAEQTRQTDAQAAFDRSLPTPDELMIPFNNTRNLFDPQGLNQQREDRDKNLANAIAASEIDLANSTAFKEPGQDDTRPRDADGNLIEAPLSPAELTQFLASQKARYQGGNVPGGSLPSENQRLIQEAAEMQENIDSNIFDDIFGQGGFLSQNYQSGKEKIKDFVGGEGKYLPDIINLGDATGSNTSKNNDLGVYTVASANALDRFGLETEDIPFSEIPGFGETTKKTPIGSGRGRLQDIPEPLTTKPDPDTDPDPDPDPDPNSAISSLESEIANMLKENEEDREKDKYLALAKMGLALMSSSQPTFGGALGEAGMAGLDDLQASRQSYRDDKITLLDAQRKLEQARATAAGKDKRGLTGTNIISRLNNIQSRKVDLQKQIAERIAKLNSIENVSIAPEQRAAQEAAIETLKREVASLDVEEKTFQSLLGGIGSLGVDLDATAN